MKSGASHINVTSVSNEALLSHFFRSSPVNAATALIYCTGEAHNTQVIRLRSLSLITKGQDLYSEIDTPSILSVCMHCDGQSKIKTAVGAPPERPTHRNSTETSITSAAKFSPRRILNRREKLTRRIHAKSKDNLMCFKCFHWISGSILS